MSEKKQGLYPKYSVMDDGWREAEGEFFILRPDRDSHAKAVAEAYPDVIACHRGRWTVRKIIRWDNVGGRSFDDPDPTPVLGAPLPDAVALPVADVHVRMVLSAYASAVEAENPSLAADLRAMCARAYLL